MRTIIRLFACVVAIMVPVRGFSQTAKAPPVKGRVLLLQNERIFEGDIEKIGAQYRLRGPAGGETWVPAERVMRLCESREAAHQYLREQANLDDPDELVRLAKWCLMYELREQALAEVKAAAELRPDHAETRRLLNHLERAAQASAAPATPGSTPAPPVAKPPARPVTSGLELNAECMGLFARRVQPILMNTCLKCHATSNASEFKLTQVFGDAPASGKSAQQNLTAVLSQIKPEQPLNSPLLRMAASAHGGSTQPPLRSRETPAYKALEQWVQLTAAHAPKNAAAVTDAPQLSLEPPAKNRFESVVTKPAKEDKISKPEAPAASKEEFAASKPEQRDEPKDEFDPVIFNRQMHPDKK
jgi:hypothetical protein